MPPDEPLGGVGKTALGVAMVRARESRRDGRLFDDPYAQAFVDAAPGVFPEEPKTGEELAALGPMASLGAMFYAHSVIRTRFFDDHLTAAAAGCSQVVLLAAGLDSRAFRLPWPQRTRVFEIDLPGVLAFKDSVLAAQGAVPRCARTTVPADLRAAWTTALAEAGFDRAAPAAWLAEGLLIYLTAAEAERLLTGISELSAPGSQLAFEHSPIAAVALTDQAHQMPAMQQYIKLWKGGLGDDAPRWLTSHGWQPEFHELATLAASYQRLVPGQARGGFLTASRVQP